MKIAMRVVCACGCGACPKPGRRFAARGHNARGVTKHPWDKAKIETAFERRAVPITETGCWIWMGALQPNGYGCFSYNCTSGSSRGVADCDQDGYFSTHPVGRGATEEFAIADLLEQIEEGA